MPNKNLSVTRGDYKVFNFFLEINTMGEEKSRSFVEGEKFNFTVRKNFYRPKVISKEITEFTEEGYAAVTIYPEDTEDLDSGDYVYDGQWTRRDGAVFTLFGPATFTILPEVTC